MDVEWGDSDSFTYHDESFVRSSVFGRSLPLAWLHAHRGDIGVGVNGERMTVCLLLGKLTLIQSTVALGQGFRPRCCSTTRLLLVDVEMQIMGVARWATCVTIQIFVRQGNQMGVWMESREYRERV